MKEKISFFNLMMFISLSLFTISCRTETIMDDQTTNQNFQLKIDTTGIYKMKDVPIFKNILIEKFVGKKVNNTNSDSLLQDKQIVNVINKNNKISYSVLTNKGNSTFQYIIFTKKDGKEQIVIAELKSNHKVKSLNLSKFTGIVYFKDIDENLLGTEKFENGKPVKNYQLKSNCGSVTTAYSCIEGLHFPGQSCAYAGSSGAAYYSTEIIKCNGDAEYINPDWGGGGSDGSGGGNNTNPYYLSPVDALNYYFQMKGGNYLTSEEIIFLNNNFDLADKLKYYFLNDDNYPNSPTFLHWTIDFLRQNPTINWLEFKSWFITRSEGEIGEYNDGVSDMVFSQQYFQQHPLPAMSAYELAFPSKPNFDYPNYYRDAQPNDVVYNDYIGGRLKQLFNQNGGSISTNPFYNACAARQSYALNKLGIMIPFQHNDLKGDNNWNYILMASKMGIFLEKTFGAPTYKLEGAKANDAKEVANFLKGKTGIYLAINNNSSQAGYSGHTDMIKNGYMSGGANVTGVHGGIKYIYIWELN